MKTKHKDTRSIVTTDSNRTSMMTIAFRSSKRSCRQRRIIGYDGAMVTCRESQRDGALRPWHRDEEMEHFALRPVSAVLDE